TIQNALARAAGQTQAATERLDRLFAPPGEPDEDDAADEFERILEGYDEDDDEEPTVPELLPAPREGQRETVQARALLEKAERGEKILCELVDGVLLEKAVGFPESVLAIYLCTVLNTFVLPRKLGLVAGSDGMMQLFPGRVRIPDVSFIRWDRLPGETSNDPV